MTEGRIPKGEPEPPDNGSGTTISAQKRKLKPADESEVQAYQEKPGNMEASEAASAMGEPEPPDTGNSGT